MATKKKTRNSPMTNYLMNKEVLENPSENIQQSEKLPKINFDIKDSKLINVELNGKEVNLYEDEKSSELFFKAICQITQQEDRHSALLSLVRTRLALCQQDGEESYAFMLNTLRQLKPNDSMEFSLIQQFLTLHDQGLNRLARATQSTCVDQSNLQVNMATKLLRLSQETLSTLMKYRNKG